MSLVLDASVVVKCLVPAIDSDKSTALLASWTRGALEVAAPEILGVEVASALWKRAIRGLLSADRAAGLYQEFLDLRIPQEPIVGLMPGALNLALRFGRCVYDCIYVALAVEMNWDLITADERLFNALRPFFYQVRLLREWE